MSERPINVNEAIQKIKAAGGSNVRAVPMSGQHVENGLYQIEIKADAGWTVIAEGMPKITANHIVQQALNKVICG